MGLKSDPTSAGHSLMVCVAVALAGKADCRSKVLWLDWCLLFSFGSCRAPLHATDTITWE